MATRQKKDRGKIPGIKVHNVVWENDRYRLDHNVRQEGGDDSSDRKAACPGPQCPDRELGFILNCSVRKGLV